MRLRHRHYAKPVREPRAMHHVQVAREVLLARQPEQCIATRQRVSQRTAALGCPRRG